MTTAQAVFDQAFAGVRSPRSEPYRLGVLTQLRYLFKEIGRTSPPYAAGSAECDAYYAGVDEACSLAREMDTSVGPSH